MHDDFVLFGAYSLAIVLSGKMSLNMSLSMSANAIWILFSARSSDIFVSVRITLQLRKNEKI